MRLHKKCNIRRIRLLFPFLIIFSLLYMAHYLQFWPYLYDVAHGELPCFANESTRLKIRHMLFSFHHLMTRENLTYWIDYGTLLGSTRHGGLIHYDHDADAGYLFRDLHQVGHVVAPALQHDYGIILDEFRPVQMQYQGTRVDLFVYGTYDEISRPLPKGKKNTTLSRGFYRVSDFFEQTYSDMDVEDVLPTRKCPFENGWLMCPNNPKVILGTRYPYSYWTNLRVPFKLRCYLNVNDLVRVMFYGQ